MSTATITPAFQNIINQRNDLNSGRDLTLCPMLSCAVYTYTNARAEPVAVGYIGRSLKVSWHFRFQSDDRRTQYINDFMTKHLAHANEKASRKATPHTLKVGDVLRSSWGYEQTNIDYYMVTSLVGKSQVVIVEIGQIRTRTSDGDGICTPDTQKITGQPLRRTVKGDRVNINSFSSAARITPTLVDGVPTWKNDRWSDYA